MGAIKTAGFDMFSERIPETIGLIFEYAGVFLSDMTNRPVLCRRRALAHESAFAIPCDVVGTRPAVATAEILPILYGEAPFDVIVKPADRPTVMWLTAVKLVHGLAIEKNIGPCHA